MRKALKTVLCVALVLALAVVIALRVLPPMNTQSGTGRPKSAFRRRRAHPGRDRRAHPHARTG